MLCNPLPHTHQGSPPSLCAQNATGPAEFDMGWLGDFVERLADFDVEMNKLVIQSGARNEGCRAVKMGD